MARAHTTITSPARGLCEVGSLNGTITILYYLRAYNIMIIIIITFLLSYSRFRENVMKPHCYSIINYIYGDNILRYAKKKKNTRCIFSNGLEIYYNIISPVCQSVVKNNKFHVLFRVNTEINSVNRRRRRRVQTRISIKRQITFETIVVVFEQFCNNPIWRVY